MKLQFSHGLLYRVIPFRVLVNEPVILRIMIMKFRFCEDKILLVKSAFKQHLQRVLRGVVEPVNTIHKNQMVLSHSMVFSLVNGYNNMQLP